MSGGGGHQRRVGEIVLGDLLADLRQHVGDVALVLFLLLGRPALLAELEVLHGDSVLERQRQDRVVDEVAVVERPPALVTRDAQQAVAHIVIHAEHVGVLVMDVVVGVLPVRRRVGVVPLPRGAVDLGIVHPVPLPVHHVVAELHVLDDLGHPRVHRHRPTRPTSWSTRTAGASGQLQPALEADRVPQVAGVPLAAAGLDVGADRVELCAECFDVGFGQMRVFGGCR